MKTHDHGMNLEDYDAAGIEHAFRDSKAAESVSEEDLHTAHAHFEHGQWWIIIDATGESFSVVECVGRAQDYIDFEQL